MNMEKSEFIKELHDESLKNGIPIIKDESAEFICNFIKKNNVRTVLEIGSAVGYSAILFACVNKNILVTTLEIDKNRADKAVQNVKKAFLENQIQVINVDAMEFAKDEISKDENSKKYDLIFIDAAKGQYRRFFKKFCDDLSKNGVIISDNLNFHGMVKSRQRINNASTRKLVKKISDYVNFLKENDEFSTEFFETGDGICVTKKKFEYKKYFCNECLVKQNDDFLIYSAKNQKIIKIYKMLPYEKSRKNVLEEFRKNISVQNLNFPVFPVIETVRKNDFCGIVFDVKNYKKILCLNDLLNFFIQQEKWNDVKILIHKFSELHKKILSFSGKDSLLDFKSEFLSYKNLILEEIGGNCIENAEKIRKLKKLSEDDFFCHGNFSLDNVFAVIKKNKKEIQNYENMELCVTDLKKSCFGPKEFDIARTYFLLEKTDKKIAKYYQEEMNVNENELEKYIF